MNCILLPKDSKAIINKEQIKHIKEVLKSKVGDTLTIGEISGNLGKATIAKISDNKVELKDILLDKNPPDKLGLSIILALPRPKVLRRLIMDMTSLGVDRLIIVNSYRTQKSYWQSPLLERVDEFIFEGLQQAVDTVPMKVEFKKRFKPFVEDELSDLLGDDNTIDGLVAHPYASQSFKSYIGTLKSKESMPNILCIGAEGGWIEYEVELFCKYGCRSVSLGDRILRTESVVSLLLGQWLINH